MNAKISKILLWLSLITVFISYISFSIFDFYTDYATYIPFVTFFLMFIINLKKINKKFSVEIKILIVIIILSLIFSYLNGSNIKLTIILATLGLGIFNISCYKTSKRELFVMKWILIGFTVIFLAYSYAYYLKDYYKADYEFNPNTVGQLLMYFGILLNCLFLKVKTSKLLIIILNILILTGLISSDSRASILGFMVFLFLFIFKSKFKNINFKYLLGILIILGTLFPIIYLNMYEKGVDFNIPFTNKSLYTGREGLWLEAVEEIEYNDNSLFLGLGSDFQRKNGDDFSAHNVYLSIIIKSGIIIELLFFYLLIRTQKHNNKILVFGVVAILINGFFETSFLWEMTFIFPILIMGGFVKDNKSAEGVKK